MCISYLSRSVLASAASRLRVLATGFILSGVHIFSYAVDSGSFEFATGNRTEVIRIGAQWDWQQKWFEHDNSFLGGYWDLTAAYWRGSRFRDILADKQNIGDVGITPVFRFQKDGKTGPYFEAAIGAHLLSALYDNNGRMLSTRFEFGDSLGAGYQFSGGWNVGLKLQHFSNGGIEHPNSGVNFAVVSVSKRFE